MMRPNPYNWTRSAPDRPIVRKHVLESLSKRLRAREGCVLLGGRGMGKSVLLQQLEEQIPRDDPSVRVFRFDGPPTPPTLRWSIRALARSLGIARTAGMQLDDIFDRYFAEHPEVSSCVLLIDELDQYATPQDRQSLGRQLFNGLEAVRKGPRGRIGILAAGGLGIYILRDALGSAFMSRVSYEHPRPFTEAEIAELSRPFDERGTPLSEAARKAIHLASGGNPALVTYSLQRLWEKEGATEQDVAAAFADFVETRPEFLRSIRDAVSHPDFSEAPLRVWDRIRQSDGVVTRDELIEVAATASGKLRMDVLDILRLLTSAGLITLEGAMSADPVHARATASILNLPPAKRHPGHLRDQLVGDLGSLLSNMHRWSPDFFRPGRSGEGKVLVPESVFTAFLGLGLRLLGWTVEREAIQGAGRTDLKLTRPGGSAVVETKLWGRNDYKEIHGQIERYWASEVVAGAAIMIHDGDERSFSSEYALQCLTRPDLAITEESAPAPLLRRFLVESRTAEGFHARVDHLLVRIPRA